MFKSALSVTGEEETTKCPSEDSPKEVMEPTCYSTQFKDIELGIINPGSMSTVVLLIGDIWSSQIFADTK